MSRKQPRSGLLSRLIGPIAAIKRRLGGSRDDAAAAAVGAHENSSLQALLDDSFTLALEQVSQEQAGRFQTKLQVVSLVEFREAVGEKWYRISEKVMMIAEGVINLHLGAGNVFGRQGQDFFVLIFRTFDAAEGRRRALTIAQELGTRLLGSQFSGHDRPLALAAEVALEDALNEDGTLNLAAIHGAVGEMRSLIAAEALAKNGGGLRAHLMPGSPCAPEDPGGLRRHMQPSELAAAEEAAGLRRHMQPSDLHTAHEAIGLRRSMLPGAPGAPGKAAEPPEPSAKDPGWRPMAQATIKPRKEDPSWEPLAEKAAAPVLAMDDDLGPPPLPADARLKLLWRPSWTAQGEAIGAYKARIQRLDGPDAQPLEGCRAYPKGGASTVALDRAVISGAMREMRAAEEAGTRATIIVPVHWASLVSDQRLALTAPFADVSQNARNNRLVLDIFGIPDDVNARQLAEQVRSCKQLCREVVMRARLHAPRAAMAADVGASMVGIDLAELASAERTDDDRLLAAMDKFRETVGRAGLGCYVWGVRRRKVVVGAVQGGFAMLNGSALMKDLPKPAKVLPAPKSRFTAA